MQIGLMPEQLVVTSIDKFLEFKSQQGGWKDKKKEHELVDNKEYLQELDI